MTRERRRRATFIQPRKRLPRAVRQLPSSSTDDLIVNVWDRDASWAGWSFESDIVVDGPVDELVLLGRRDEDTGEGRRSA